MTEQTDERAFFERYAEASLTGEPAVLARMYAPSFLVAGPKGSATFANDTRFLEWLDGAKLVPLPAGLSSYLQQGYIDALAAKIELTDEQDRPVPLPDSNCLIAVEKS